jgi:hypothetical protein
VSAEVVDFGLDEPRFQQLLDRAIRFLRWRGSADPEGIASEAMLRLIQNLRAGTVIHDLDAYVVEVARRVKREEDRTAARLARLLTALARSPSEASVDEPSLDCLERCKKECLSAKERRLLDAYYKDEVRNRAEHRAALAAKLGISPNALSLSVFKIRRKLAVCVEKCLERRQNADTRSK